MPASSKLFRSNRSQAVRLPKEIAFADDVKDVVIRKVGEARIIMPANAQWDDFFAMSVCDDFPERGDQPNYEERERL